MSKKKKVVVPKHFGTVPFTLEASDLALAKSFGLLREDTPMNLLSPQDDNFGVAQDGKRNIGVDFYQTQQAIQQRCKQYALQAGFQLIVQCSSSQNAKYCCKKLNGQQFIDSTLPADQAACPFFINTSGKEGRWQFSKASFCHNHLRNVGFSKIPCAEGSISRPAKSLRNTTQDTSRAKALIEQKMLPAHDGSTSTMTGTGIRRFLKSEGINMSTSAISRVKLSVEASLLSNREVSYQKLEAYLLAMASKNPGSFWRFETDPDGTFKRACFIPNVGVRIAQMSRRMFGYDGAHLKAQMNSYGVFLVATANDYNKQVTPFALALVPKENQDHWTWFLYVVKEALGPLQAFTAVSDRQKGLLNAVTDVFPQAGHRYCLVHIKRNITVSNTLTSSERNLINELVDSDCENDFTLFYNELRSSNKKATDKLDTIPRRYWVKYAFLAHNQLPTYGESISNVAEQANNWLGDDCRSAYPLDAFNLYFMKLCERASKMRQLAATWTREYGEDALVPFLAKRRDELAAASDMCESLPCMEGSYLVRYLGPVKRDGFIHPWRNVDLPGGTCTCRGWQDYEPPCLHAVTAAIQDGQRLETLYDAKRLSIRHFRESYSLQFVPLPLDGEFTRNENIKVPTVTVATSEKGKRGEKPGPKPKHKRRKTKGSN